MPRKKPVAYQVTIMNPPERRLELNQRLTAVMARYVDAVDAQLYFVADERQSA